MKCLPFFLALNCLFITSCSGDKRFDQYAQIIDNADRINFYSRSRSGDPFTLTREVVSLEYLQSLKNVLKRHVKAEYPRKFISSHKIEMYKQGKLLGSLLISDSKEYPFVNFQNKEFGFGFRLSYGIGMSL